MALAQILPEENRHSPERMLETTRKGRAGSFSFRMAAGTHQEFRQSSFPFLERTYTGSPSEYKRFPPTGEKPQDPWGSLAGQDSFPQGMSQGRAWSMNKPRNRTGAYRFRNRNSCGTRKKWRHGKEVLMLRPPRMREVKRKSKSKIRTKETRFVGQCVADCASRAS